MVFYYFYFVKLEKKCLSIPGNNIVCHSRMFLAGIQLHFSEMDAR